MMFYDLKAGLNHEECFQRLQLAFSDEPPCGANVFKSFNEFCSGHNSLLDEEHTEGHGRQQCLAVASHNVPHKPKPVAHPWFMTSQGLSYEILVRFQVELES
ncbi:hypothetical protein TNCV_2438791 [Trichonephila clavipes]|nr:hypothetical protein TNCV_2438791 [Trichonephila clavipes]